MLIPSFLGPWGFAHFFYLGCQRGVKSVVRLHACLGIYKIVRLCITSCLCLSTPNDKQNEDVVEAQESDAISISTGQQMVNGE